MRHGKRGFISNDLPPILERPGISAKAYLQHVRQKQKQTRALGRLSHLLKEAEQLEQQFLKGAAQAKQPIPEPAT